VHHDCKRHLGAHLPLLLRVHQHLEAVALRGVLFEPCAKGFLGRVKKLVCSSVVVLKQVGYVVVISELQQGRACT